MRAAQDPTIGAVKAELARRDLTQEALADHLGVSRAYVYRRLNGDVPWNVQDLRRVARFVSVPLEQLMASPVSASPEVADTGVSSVGGAA